MTSISRELRLLLACARSRATAAEQDEIRLVLDSGIDWGRFAQLAVDCGLAGFAGQTLCRVGADKVPDDLRDAIGVVIERTRKSSSALLNEFVTIAGHLRSSGIEPIPMKDFLLATHIYGDLGLRAIRELDFLVRDSDFATAISMLERIGYEREGSLTPGQQRLLRHIQGRAFLVKKNKQIAVKPHTRIVPLHLAVHIDYAGIWQRAKPMVTADQKLLLFAPEDELLALALQAGKEFWQRIISVCDVAAFIRSHADLDWAAIVERARTQGCLRMTVVALSLARRFFNAELPDAISKLERGDRLSEPLVMRAVEGWTRVERGEQWVRRRNSKDLLLLHDGLRQRARYVARALLIPDPADVRRIALPRSWNAAYAPLAIAHKRIVLPVRKLRQRAGARLASRSRRRTSPKQSWDFAEARGVILPGQAELEKSRTRALEAIKNDPRNTDALYELARALFRLDRLDDALEAYERIILADPQQIRAKEEVLGLLIRYTRFNDAERMARALIPAAPDLPAAIIFLARRLAIWAGTTKPPWPITSVWICVRTSPERSVELD